MTHILIVEDHEENRNLLKLLLEANAYRVTAAGDGIEALAAARRDRPDAIVSDALMPRMDGFDLCRQWMQDAGLKAIPFIFYSATYVRPVDELFGEALGAVRYLIKPLQADVFLSELRGVLQEWAGRAAPDQAAPLDDVSTQLLHESALARKVEDKVAQLEAANRKLQESEARFRSLFESMLNGFAYCKMEYDEHGHAVDFVYLDVNNAFRRLTGLKDVIGRKVSEVIPGIREASPELFEIYGRVASTGIPESFEFDFKSMGKWLTVSVYSPATGYFVAIFDDITARKKMELELRAAEEQFRSLVEQSIAGTYIIQDGKIAYVNPRYLEILGYHSADELIGRDVLSLVAVQDRDAVAEQIRRRIEGGATHVKYEHTAVRADGSTVDIGVHGSRATYRGRPAIIGLIQDISEKKRAEEQIQRYVVQIENAFMSTVQVVMALGEMRDPYTAGHQRRVAEIAVAIGSEIGLDAHQLEGLRVAGYLHDVGKIRIPSEILSKPGKLSPTEFQLVQGHAQASYDVLKSVEFPWPVAEVALQHHERMDGSGYPRGLKAEAILLEARVMAVADVIEAMSSHRPYRAGLGIERALAEVERGRTSSYDPDVADACLRLFREQNYQVPS